MNAPPFHVAVAVVVLIAVTSALPVAAQQAVVRSPEAGDAEIGQAWFLRSGDRCLALLPQHVVAEAGFPMFLSEGGHARSEAVTTDDLGEDIAVASVRGHTPVTCATTMGSVSRAVDRLLRDGGIGTLRSLNGDGTVARLTVAVVDDDGEGLLRVKPTLESERIRKGLSGSLLLIDGTPAGMLLSVNARTGVGTVMRVDRLLRQVESHLRTPPMAASPASVESAGGWEVTGWNADPSASTSSARWLLEDAPGYAWQARATSWPVVLEFTHPAGVRMVRGLQLVEDASAGEARRPARIQVFVSVAAGTPQWRSLSTNLLSYENGMATVQFPSMRARQVRIEIYRITDTDSLALRKLRILEGT